MKKKPIIITAVILVFLIGVGCYFYFSDENRLTAEERRWLNDNIANVQNVYVVNDVNVFGNLGEGIYYQFLEDFTKAQEINFNPITITNTEESTGLALEVGNGLPTDALDFYTDHFVLVGKSNESITDSKNIKNKNIGVLTRDAEYIRNYFSSLEENTFTPFETLEDLITNLNSNTVNNILIPRMENMDKIIEQNYWIQYHFSDLTRNYYIKDETNSTLFQILKKYYNSWKEENLEAKIYEEERKIFTTGLKISDTALDELQKEPLEYGYLNYLPYEIYGDGRYGGIVSQYLTRFAEFANIEIDYQKYNSEKKYTRDVNNNELDLYTNFSNLGLNGQEISLNLPITFDIYAHKENPIVIESIESLKNKVIYVEEDSYLQTRLSILDGCTLKTFDLSKIDSILKDEENLILLDHQVGNYLLKSSLEDYSSRYTYNLTATYSLKSLGNETLNTLLTRYFNYLDNKMLTNLGIPESELLEKRGSFIGSLARWILWTIIIIAIILLLIYRSSKKVRLQKKIKKEDKLKYIDQLTSLKNRNYLNENLSTWNKNTIYPQSVVMIDLNKVQEINDTSGYEQGDKQIKAAANILIKTQLDNSDIIRTNGNEFMIYFVGYTQKQITSYMHKLNKNFKNLPFDYGICISYSMIDSDLKSIEDAINECVEDIKKQKEQKKDEEK